MAEEKHSKREEVPDACPHCGNKLSPWQQVLLATDRALVCKNCWYRIILDVVKVKQQSNLEKSKGESE